MKANGTITKRELSRILRGLKRGIRRASDIRRLAEYVQTTTGALVESQQRADIRERALHLKLRLANNSIIAHSNAVAHWRERAEKAEAELIDIKILT